MPPSQPLRPRGPPFLALAAEQDHEERDIDVLFVANLHPAVQRERLPWIARLAGLSGKRSVVIRTGVFGDDYRALLRRAKIVFNRGIRGECNQRVFEAAAAGALLFQESGNREVPDFFEPGTEYVAYSDTNLEYLLEHYLGAEDERRSIATAARRRVPGHGFANQWRALWRRWKNVSTRPGPGWPAARLLTETSGSAPGRGRRWGRPTKATQRWPPSSRPQPPHGRRPSVCRTPWG